MDTRKLGFRYRLAAGVLAAGLCFVATVRADELGRARARVADPGRSRRGRQQARPGAGQPGRQPLVPAVPVQQLPADERAVELQPELPARDARQPDEGRQPDHAPRGSGLQQRPLRDLHGRRGAHHQFRRLDAARALLAGAQRLLAARLRTDLHLPDRRLRLHRAGEVSGGPRPRRRLHDAQVHPRGLPAAVVVVRRRREPAEHEPDQHPADRESLLRGRLERRLLGQHHGQLEGPGRQPVDRPDRHRRRQGRQVRAPSRSRSASPGSTWSCSRTRSARSGTSRSS